MRISLNGISTKQCDLVKDVELAKKYRFNCLEIEANKLDYFLSKNKISALEELFADEKIIPASINYIENVTFRYSDEFEQMKDRCEELCEIASRIGCKTVILKPSHKPLGISDDQIIEESLRALNALSEIANDFDVNLGLKFIGFPEYSVNNIELCYKIIEQAKYRDNVGLVIDTFYLYTSGFSGEFIKKINKKDIYLVHLADAEDIPRGNLKDINRVMPGQGAIPLKVIIHSIRQTGFDGIFSVELLRPEYWKWGIEKLVSDLREKTEMVLQGL